MINMLSTVCFSHSVHSHHCHLSECARKHGCLCNAAQSNNEFHVSGSETSDVYACFIGLLKVHTHLRKERTAPCGQESCSLKQRSGLG